MGTTRHNCPVCDGSGDVFYKKKPIHELLDNLQNASTELVDLGFCLIQEIDELRRANTKLQVQPVRVPDSVSGDIGTTLPAVELVMQDSDGGMYERHATELFLNSIADYICLQGRDATAEKIREIARLYSEKERAAADKIRKLENAVDTLSVDREETLSLFPDHIRDKHAPHMAAAVKEGLDQLRIAMTAVASMPGRDWLTGQLALAEALQGGGKHLNAVLLMHFTGQRPEESHE